MKRSEMIDIMLEYHRGAIRSTDGRITKEELMGRILDGMVSEGMLPPEVITDIYNRQDCCFYYKNEWEKE